MLKSTETAIQPTTTGDSPIQFSKQHEQLAISTALCRPTKAERRQTLT